jgi:hypothetical protein
MKERSSQSDALIPAPAMLEAWADDNWSNGVQIDELTRFETLSVETMHHTYELTVVDAGTAKVLIRGGEFFPARKAYLSGASVGGGSFLKVYGIYVGFKMELHVGRRRIITSPVRRIQLCRSLVQPLFRPSSEFDQSKTPDKVGMSASHAS